MRWTTRSGEQVELQDMTDLHLKNAISFVRRRLDLLERDFEVDESALEELDVHVDLRIALEALLVEQERRAVTRARGGKSQCGPT